MRIPYPERIPLYPVFLFCLVLCLMQQLQGTSAIFSAGTVSFILLSTIAFNVTGGLTRPSGGFILSYAVLAAMFGIVYKVIVGEPGQSNLLQPNLTIELYAASAAGLLVSAYLARRFRLKKSYLPQFDSDEKMYRGSIGCLIVGVGIFLIFLLKTSPVTNGSLLGILRQLNVFLPLATLLGVTAEIRRSGGRRSINAAVLTTICLIFFEGVHSYSKEGMLMPFVCWLIPAAAQRYKISILQLAVVSIGLLFTLYYLVPYSQYGRYFKDSTAPVSEQLQTNFLLLSNLDLVRKVYMQSTKELYVEDTFHYYNDPQGIADRTQMITPDDAIINATEQGAVFGIYPTIFAFENLIPHFLWPDKPTVGFNNMYARELGVLTDDDTTTGVSFSMTGEAYHQAKWAGVLLMIPLLSFMMFFTVDSVCGDTRLSPFALLPLLVYSHLGPEGGLVQFVFETSLNLVQIFFAAFIGAYVMPLLTGLILGAPKDRTRGNVVVASRSVRFLPAETPPAVAER